MALIKCSECGKEISDKAPACPSCGNPLQTHDNQKPVIIEQTDKKWKSIQLISGILFWAGIFMMFAAFGNKNADLGGLGVLFFLLGIIGSNVGKIGAWWNHR